MAYSWTGSGPEALMGVVRTRVAILLTAMAVLATGPSGQAQAAREYLIELAPETPTARTLRHEQVEARRSGPVVMVHRGASALAPENTLLAYARALDCGADGVEADVRRTADGVLVLFHDDVLDRLTHGIGAVSQLTARELLALKPRSAFGRPAGGTPPSFVQLLDLARQRAMLLHLDLKEDGLEDEVAQWLDAADCWDHVVSVNPGHAPRLSADPRIRPLRYKVPGLYAQRQDLDPGRVEEALRQAGQMILVDDPRVAARLLGREPYTPVVLSQTFRYLQHGHPLPPRTTQGGFDPTAHLAALTLRVNPNSVPPLIALLEAPVPVPGSAWPVEDADRRLTARLVERAWAADRLGQLGRKTRPVVRALELLVQTPLSHPDWRYGALDGGLAARALGQLEATESADVLIAAFQRTYHTPPDVMPSAQSRQGDIWAATRFQLHLLSALGDLRCRAARRFLRDYVAMEETPSAESGPRFFEEATRALLRQNLAWDSIARLLRSPNPSVRGTALLECLDWPNEERRKALTAATGWALALPRVPFGVAAPRAAPPLVRSGVAAPRKHAP